MMRSFLFVLLLFCLSSDAFSRTKPVIPETDRIRIAEAFRIGEALRNEVWPGWDKAPFSLLFITDDHEFLLRHPRPSDEFESLGHDALLKSEVFVRPRKFQKNFLATFPAFGRTPVIVVGRAENTSEKTSTPWVFVVLHEHFHQLQFSRPNYFDDVDALNLARGDTTGMWQINFPFPYENSGVAEKFKTLSERLAAAYGGRGGREGERKLAEYLAERQAFAGMLDAEDFRYASFQFWQEGIARYTQYKMAQLAARKTRPSRAFRGLSDYTPFENEARRLLDGMLGELRGADLVRSKRVAFYPFGAVEGLLLDEVSPGWRKKYFSEKFALEKFYPEDRAGK